MKNRLSAAISAAVLVGGIALSSITVAESWSDSAEVWRGLLRCVSYRARQHGEYLIVEASHDPNWHTYAMDNRQRADKKLAGKLSLGIEQPTRIDPGQGLEVIGTWYQSKPENLSRPELRWYTWGFSDLARFVVKVKRTGSPSSVIAIRGQACDSETCQNIDLKIRLTLTAPRARSNQEIDLRKLVKVEMESQLEKIPGSNDSPRQ
jgi:hypothetical protein